MREWGANALILPLLIPASRYALGEGLDKSVLEKTREKHVQVLRVTIKAPKTKTVTIRTMTGLALGSE